MIYLIWLGNALGIPQEETENVAGESDANTAPAPGSGWKWMELTYGWKSQHTCNTSPNQVQSQSLVWQCFNPQITPR